FSFQSHLGFENGWRHRAEHSASRGAQRDKDHLVFIAACSDVAFFLENADDREWDAVDAYGSADRRLAIEQLVAGQLPDDGDFRPEGDLVPAEQAPYRHWPFTRDQVTGIIAPDKGGKMTVSGNDLNLAPNDRCGYSHVRHAQQGGSIVFGQSLSRAGV